MIFIITYMDNKNHLWVEKYRPCNLDEISAQSNVIKSLRSAIITKNIPHLIFFGPSGCGKTSTIIALAKDLFGLKNYSDRIIELNASDERGINIIREKIKMYSKQSIKNVKGIPPWKIIVLDEADTMTTDSQFALRQIMEKYSKITRFCIICNYYNKIIDPIISRCALFRFKPIDPQNIYNKLEYICKQENVKYSDKLLEKIIIICKGDLRKAVNLLQKCYNSYDDNINIEILDNISGVIPENNFNKLIEYIVKKDNKNVDLLINQINLESYSLVNQIMIFHNYIINSNIDSRKKSEILCKLTEIDQSLIKGCDEYIQFMKLVYFIMITLD
jgi:replication factor C subunit 2/4